MEDESNMIEEKKEISPYEYFSQLKEKVNSIDDEELKVLYLNALDLAKKFKRTGQKNGLKKLRFHLESIIKEREIVKMGLTKYVYKDDIEEYIRDVAQNVVKVEDLPRYERIIPDEIIEAVEKTKDLFDEFYVVFTDYTGKEERKVEKERREKDPILFGAFIDRGDRVTNERFYYIGDWIDEYCDLTLDKMVAEMKEKVNKDIVNELIEIPKDKEELKSQLNSLQLEEEEDKIKLHLISSDSESKERKIHFFDKVKMFFKNK